MHKRPHFNQLVTLGGFSLFLLLLTLLVFLPPVNLFVPKHSTEITEVEFVRNVGHREFPVDEGANWRGGTLPDDWRLNQKAGDDYWYRYTLQIDALPKETMAVYFPMVSHNVAVYVNGVWFGQGGQFETPVARNHNTPLLFAFAPDLLREGKNILHFRVSAATSAQGLLDKLYVDTYSELAPAYAIKYAVRISLVKWITGVMLVMAFVLACFWGYRRYDSAYGVFSLILLFWGLHNLNIFIVEIPISSKNWETLAILTLGWTVSSFILFDHRYLNRRFPLIEKTMLFHSLVGFLLFLTPDYESLLFWGYTVWYAFLVVFGVYASYFLFSVYLQENNRDALLMLVVGAVIVVFGVHDILLVNNHWTRFDGFIIQYSSIPTVVLFGWFLLQRFLKSLETAENLAKTLELRVEQKQVELEAQYKKLYTMEKQQVLSEERERMMRDMHDGVGGSLVSLSSMFQKQDGELFKRAYDKVQDSITDLRLVIDSLDPMLNDLVTLLATMRIRLLDQLESVGIELNWDVEEMTDSLVFSPQQSLHIMRILQEAITNSVKHAETERLDLTTELLNDGCVRMLIRDYGKGIADEKCHTGHGITNMRWRAKQLGGELNIISHQKGTAVQLLFPPK